jgi:hypothetical protein
VTRRADPGRPVHVHPDVVAFDAQRLAGVDADPDAEAVVVAFLDRPRRCDGAVGLGERRRELVAAAVDLLAACLTDRHANHRPVALERGRVVVTQLLDEARRGLDVGEEERDHTSSLKRSSAAVHGGGAHDQRTPPWR